MKGNISSLTGACKRGHVLSASLYPGGSPEKYISSMPASIFEKCLWQLYPATWRRRCRTSRTSSPPVDLHPGPVLSSGESCNA